MPTKDRLTYLRESLAGILAQGGVDLEIVVSDNRSTDGTAEFLDELASRDARVRVVRPDRPLGLYANHNFAFAAARGDLVCFFHDDDRYGPDLLSRYVAFLAAHPRVGVVCAAYMRIDASGRVLGVRRSGIKPVTPGVDYIDRTLRTARSALALSGCMVRRVALPAAPFDESGTVGFSDIALWFRIAERWDVGHIPEPLWSYRQHPGAASRRSGEIPREFALTFEAYCDDYLIRHPADHARVGRWRDAIRRFRFWAVLYDVATRTTTEPGPAVVPLDVRAKELSRLAHGPFERAVASAARGLLRLGLGRMLGALLRYTRLTRALVLTR